MIKIINYYPKKSNTLHKVKNQMKQTHLCFHQAVRLISYRLIALHFDQ